MPLIRPHDVSNWGWYDPRPEDQDLWRNCLIAASEAKVADVTGTAQKMYAVRGGVMLSYGEIAKRKRAAAKAARAKAMVRP